MLDFKRMASAKNIPFAEGGHHHCHQGWAQTHCPFCAGGRGGWHLGFSLEYGNWNCWRCGPLRFWDVVCALLHTSKVDAIEVVRQFQKGGKTNVARTQKARPRILKPPLGAKPMVEQHMRYLRGRGFDPDHLEAEWDLLGTRNLSKEWNWRVVIPIRSGDGQIVAYQGRSISPDTKPKYRMTEEPKILDNPRGLLYGIERVRGNSILVVEGVTGVWRIGPGTVATFGIDWKPEQANRIRRFEHKYIMFDPEPKAQQRAYELATYCSKFPGTTEVIAGFDVDPGDLSDGEATKIRKGLGLLD